MTEPDNDPHPSRREHWNRSYVSGTPEEVSWYQQTLKVSLDLIAACGLGPDARIIDVGGGASTLVDTLLAQGYRNLTVLDVSAAGLGAARDRLGARAADVVWLEEDITHWRPQETYDLWHDRAVFHFLTDPADRAAYRTALEAALAPGGRAIIATFAPEGPDKCSGLSVVRYSPETLSGELGPGLAPAGSRSETHVTPGGVSQAFVYCSFIRR